MSFSAEALTELPPLLQVQPLKEKHASMVTKPGEDVQHPSANIKSVSFIKCTLVRWIVLLCFVFLRPAEFLQMIGLICVLLSVWNTAAGRHAGDLRLTKT